MFKYLLPPMLHTHNTADFLPRILSSLDSFCFRKIFIFTHHMGTKIIMTDIKHPDNKFDYLLELLII